MAARAVGNVTPETAQHDWALARELGIRITVHVGMRLTGVHVNHVLGMHEAGVMGPDTTYIHCTDSTDEELDLIAETGGSASVAPYVEMLMGHGRAADRPAASRAACGRRSPSTSSRACRARCSRRCARRSSTSGSWRSPTRPTRRSRRR